MSWSAQLEVQQGVIPAEPVLSNVVGEEAEYQYSVALGSALSILGSGAVGSPDKKYNVALSGHANPGHEPVAGWSNNCITINIYQLGEEA